MGVENSVEGNCSFNTTRIEEQHYQVDIVLSTISCVICLVGMVGNILVIYVFRFQHKTQTVTEKLIIYLGAGDLLGSIINPIVFSSTRVTKSHEWHFGEIGCKILPGLQKITISVSIGIMLLIAIYRCLMICQIYSYTFSLHYLLIIVFIFSIIIRAPYMSYLELHCKTCHVHENNNITLSILLAEDLVFILIFSITLCFIYKTLYNKETMQVLKSQLDHQRNQRVVFMVVMMAVIFLATVLPRHLFLIVTGFLQLNIKHLQKKSIGGALEILYMCNCVCNPFIYGKLHNQFRKGVIKSIRVLSERSRRLVSSHRRQYLVANGHMVNEQTGFKLKRPLKERLKMKARKDLEMTVEDKFIVKDTKF